jgi:hypothetical protein
MATLEQETNNGVVQPPSASLAKNYENAHITTSQHTPSHSDRRVPAAQHSSCDHQLLSSNSQVTTCDS